MKPGSVAIEEVAGSTKVMIGTTICESSDPLQKVVPDNPVGKPTNGYHVGKPGQEVHRLDGPIRLVLIDKHGTQGVLEPFEPYKVGEEENNTNKNDAVQEGGHV